MIGIVTLTHTEGQIHISPAQVVAVQDHVNGTLVHFVGGTSKLVNEDVRSVLLELTSAGWSQRP